MRSRKLVAQLRQPWHGAANHKLIDSETGRIILSAVAYLQYIGQCTIAWTSELSRYAAKPKWIARHAIKHVCTWDSTHPEEWWLWMGRSWRIFPHWEGYWRSSLARSATSSLHRFLSRSACQPCSQLITCCADNVFLHLHWIMEQAY